MNPEQDLFTRQGCWPCAKPPTWRARIPQPVKARVWLLQYTNGILGDGGTTFPTPGNTSLFHPQTNGSLERSHRTLAEYLRHYVDKGLNNWDQFLPYAFFGYNSTIHTSTNYQPYSLVYGRTLEIPIKLKCEPEPRYNYDDYVYELKQKLQESHKIAKERLIQTKIKSKKGTIKKNIQSHYMLKILFY